MECDDAVHGSIGCRRQLSPRQPKVEREAGVGIADVVVARWWRLEHGQIPWQLDVLLIGMDIFLNKQVRKFCYNTTMFYVSYYLAYSYGLWPFQYHDFVTNTLFITSSQEIHKGSSWHAEHILSIRFTH